MMKFKPHISSGIFCIGFNKTGTVSLHEAFQECGIKSLHDKNWVKMANSGRLPDYEAFSDGNVSQLDLNNLKNLRRNCKFILNTRKLRSWLISRCKHAYMGHQMGRRPMYQISEIVDSIKVRQIWHKKALSVSPFIFEIENKQHHQELAQFLGLNLNIPHSNKREINDSKLKNIERDVDKSLEIANIPHCSWEDII